MTVLHPVAAGQLPPARVPVGAIIRTWGLRLRHSHRLGGNRNAHWVVVTTDGQFVLRCYRLDRDDAAIEYEFAVLEHLHSRGWPVACPVGGLRRWGGRTFALFPRLPGRHRTDRGDAEIGGLLGALHADLQPLALGQRSGWRSLDVYIAGEHQAIAADARARICDPTLRDALVRNAEQTAEVLTGDVRHLPRSLVHGDFVSWNLLWHKGHLSGVVDFDDVRHDLRAADVASTRRSNRDSVVRGYRRTAALSDEEAELAAPLWRAYTLVYAGALLRATTLSNVVMSALHWCAAEMQATLPYPTRRHDSKAI